MHRRQGIVWNCVSVQQVHFFTDEKRYFGMAEGHLGVAPGLPGRKWLGDPPTSQAKISSCTSTRSVDIVSVFFRLRQIGDTHSIFFRPSEGILSDAFSVVYSFGIHRSATLGTSKTPTVCTRELTSKLHQVRAVSHETSIKNQQIRTEK